MTLANAAAVCLLTADWDLALDYAERGQRAAGPIADPERAVFLLFVRGCVRFHMGAWDGAQVTLECAANVAADSRARATAHYPWLGLGLLAMGRGHQDQAASHLEQAARAATNRAEARALPYLEAALAEFDLLDGRAGAAWTRLRALTTLPAEQGSAAFVQARLAWAQLELGEPEAAMLAAAGAAQRARADHTPVRVVDSLWVQARALLACRRGMEATPLLDEALALARRLPYALGMIRVLETAAHLHAGLGHAGLAGTYRDEAQAWRERLSAPLAAASSPQRLMLLQNQEPPLHKSRRSLRNSEALLQNDLLPGVPRLTGALWERIAALLPSSAHTGRPRVDDRRTLKAIVYVQATGCAWGNLPSNLGNGVTAFRRWRAWQASGIWDAIAALLAEADEPERQAQ